MGRINLRPFLYIKFHSNLNFRVNGYFGLMDILMVLHLVLTHGYYLSPDLDIFSYLI